MFEKEFDYFVKNQKELYKKYPDKTLVIIGESIDGVYGSALQAYEQTIREHRAGSFMIQFCGADSSAYTVHISSFELA